MPNDTLTGKNIHCQSILNTLTDTKTKREEENRPVPFEKDFALGREACLMSWSLSTVVIIFMAKLQAIYGNISWSCILSATLSLTPFKLFFQRLR